MAEGFNTRAAHAGPRGDPTPGAVVAPLHLSTTYVHDAVAQPRGAYEYGRSGNPTRDVLQAQLAALEGGRVGFAFASGMAAIDVVLRALVRPGDYVLLPADVYGGTFRLAHKVLGEWGAITHAADISDTAVMCAHIRDHGPAAVLLETPSNPMMRIADIAALCAAAHEVGAVVVVDNTFATPYLQRPPELSADIVVHSTTKYIGGHSDTVGGAAIVSDDALAEKLGFLQNAAGAVAGPMDCWLTSRGLRTLGVRMERHCANAQAVAEHLRDHPAVRQVLYPGLPDHPGHDLAAAQMSRFSGMVSVRLADEAAARRLCESTRLFALAESLGGVESLVCHPWSMTHASVQGTDVAVPADLVRLSVGIEDVADLIADLDQALA